LTPERPSDIVGKNWSEMNECHNQYFLGCEASKSAAKPQNAISFHSDFDRARPVLLSLLLLVAPMAVQAQFQLSPPGMLTNGSFSFSLSGPLGRTYVIETSTNLTAWNPMITNTLPMGSVSFVDTNSPLFQSHFYRGQFYWTVIVPNIYLTWITTNSGDGRFLAFPSGWNTAQGADGRAIAFPPGWNTAEGADGRTIAFPPAWNTAQGSDGRMIAFPSGFSTNQGADGRLAAFQQTGFSTVQGSDGRIAALPSSSWTDDVGADGRQAAFPSMDFQTNQGLDGRLVAFPSPGWITGCGADARNVAYPSSDFVTSQGADGRDISLLSSDWASLQGPDGRMSSYPTSPGATIELDFQDQSLFARFGTLQPLLSPLDFSDYVIYVFFGTGEQQFAN
jgi:hypothetical protein